MSRVAATLGFTTMSLYRYVTSKDDLLVLMEDAASEMPVPAEDDDAPWRDGVRRVGHRRARRLPRRIRGSPTFRSRGAPMTPNSLLAWTGCCASCAALPLDDAEKMSSLLLLTSYVRATAAIEARPDARPWRPTPRGTAERLGRAASTSSRPSGSPT